MTPPLPTWVEDEKYSQHDKLNLLAEALEIAWEALERIQDRAKRIQSGVIKTKAYGSADYDIQVCEGALQRIAECGGEK